LIVLDATELLSDPTCSGTAWHVVAHAAANDPSVVVPEIVVVEAAAGMLRTVQEARTGLDRWREKHARRIGMTEIAQHWDDELDAVANRYEDELRRRLSSLDVQIIPPVDVDHLTVVRRATQRQPPCNGNGDGYRDTLNWLTLLDQARSAAD
jgi:hypothetical protein